MSSKSSGVKRELAIVPIIGKEFYNYKVSHFISW